jgi:hypothetical protein
MNRGGAKPNAMVGSIGLKHYNSISAALSGPANTIAVVKGTSYKFMVFPFLLLSILKLSSWAVKTSRVIEKWLFLFQVHFP